MKPGMGINSIAVLEAGFQRERAMVVVEFIDPSRDYYAVIDSPPISMRPA
jgi:hypothetical protein